MRNVTRAAAAVALGLMLATGASAVPAFQIADDCGGGNGGLAPQFAEDSGGGNGGPTFQIADDCGGGNGGLAPQFA